MASLMGAGLEFFETERFRPDDIVRLTVMPLGAKVIGRLVEVSALGDEWFVRIETGTAQTREVRLDDVAKIEVGE